MQKQDNYNKPSSFNSSPDKQNNKAYFLGMFSNLSSMEKLNIDSNNEYYTDDEKRKMLELINNEKKYPYNMQKKMKISKNNNTNYQQSINTNSITEGISDNYNEFFYGQYNHQNQLKNYIANSNKNEKIKNNNSLNNKNRIPYSENPIKQNISNNKMIQNNNKNLYISSYNDNQRAYNSFDKQTEKSGKTFKESRNNTNNNNIPVKKKMMTNNDKNYTNNGNLNIGIYPGIYNINNYSSDGEENMNYYTSSANVFSKGYNFDNKSRRSFNNNNVYFNTQKDFYSNNQTPVRINNKMDRSNYISNQKQINSYLTKSGKRKSSYN